MQVTKVETEKSRDRRHGVSLIALTLCVTTVVELVYLLPYFHTNSKSTENTENTENMEISYFTFV